MKNDSFFERFAKRAAAVSGSPYAFLTAGGLIVVWGLLGPVFHYSDTWQLVINTSTTIITFLMVFLIQNTQNKDTMALQLKLDELIRANGKAHNAMLDLEELSERELTEIRDHYEHIAQDARRHLREHKGHVGEALANPKKD